MSPWKLRFSYKVRRSSRLGSWNTTPRLRRAASGFLTTSMPLMRALPLSGLRMVQRICPKVVLPAPLGPSSANNSLRRTSKPTLSNASVRPNRLLTPSIATAGSDMVVTRRPPRKLSDRCAFAGIGSLTSFHGSRGKFVAVQNGLDGAVAGERGNRLVDIAAQEGFVRQHRGPDIRRGGRKRTGRQQPELRVAGIAALQRPERGAPDQ